MNEGSQIPPSQAAQGGQSASSGGKGLGSTAIAIIVIVVVAVVIIGSVGAYLLLREVVDDIGTYKYTEPVEHEYPAAAYTALDVSNVNGYLRIVGDEDATVIDIDGLKKADTEEELDDIELRITEDDGTLVLEVVHDEDNAENEAMDLDITIPSDIVVKNADSVNGEVEISGVESIVRVDSTNDDIRVEVIGIDSNMSISSTNGAVEVHILTSLDATIDMSTLNGDISLNDVSLDLITDEPVDFPYEGVSGTLNSGGFMIEIVTLNGDIDLYALD